MLCFQQKTCNIQSRYLVSLSLSVCRYTMELYGISEWR